MSQTKRPINDAFQSSTPAERAPKFVPAGHGTPRPIGAIANALLWKWKIGLTKVYTRRPPVWPREAKVGKGPPRIGRQCISPVTPRRGPRGCITRPSTDSTRGSTAVLISLEQWKWMPSPRRGRRIWPIFKKLSIGQTRFSKTAQVREGFERDGSLLWVWKINYFKLAWNWYF